MATSSLTSFPIPTNDSLAVFGIASTAGGAYSGGLAVGVVPSFAADFCTNLTWSNQHGHYGFIDDGTFTWSSAPAPAWGHASFNCNVKLSVSSGITLDHHNSYQSYPHSTGSGTSARISGLHHILDHTGSGTVSENSAVLVQDATGTGPITAQYGLKVESLTRATKNWGLYTLGVTPSLVGGLLHFGVEGATATVGCNANGNLDITPRPTYLVDVKGPLRVIATAGIRLLDTGVTVGASVAATTSGLELTTDGAPTIFKTSGAERFRLGASGGMPIATPIQFPSYTLATLPSAATFSGYCIEVSNATGGPRICRSNGTVWQILNTTTTVS